MLIQPILVVTFINFICAAVGWGVINRKADKAGKSVALTAEESAARKMMIANLFLSLAALALGAACYLAEGDRMLSGIEPLVKHGKWAVLGLMVINLGLSAGAFAKINTADKSVTEGYLKHSRNSMLVNTVLGLLGALFVFDKVPTIVSGSDMTASSLLASAKGLFSRGDANAATGPAPMPATL
jgi:hypothetical protein